jgi:hypothetical protein
LWSLHISDVISHFNSRPWYDILVHRNVLYVTSNSNGKCVFVDDLSRMGLHIFCQVTSLNCA